MTIITSVFTPNTCVLTTQTSLGTTHSQTLSSSIQSLTLAISKFLIQAPKQGLPTQSAATTFPEASKHSADISNFNPSDPLTATSLSTSILVNHNQLTEKTQKVFKNNPSSLCSAQHQNTKNTVRSLHTEKMPDSDSLISQIVQNSKPNHPNTSKQMEAMIKNSRDLVQALYQLKNKKCGLDPQLLRALLQKQGDFKLIKKLFENSSPKIKDPYVIAQYIKIAGNCGCFNEAKKVFDMTETHHGIIDDFICTSYITAAGNNGCFDEAKRTFDIAKTNNTLDHWVCSCYIKAASDNGCFDEAKRAFNIAKANDTLNSFICCTYIKAAGEYGYVDEATRAFNLLKLKRQNNSDKIVSYGTFIDCLLSNKMFDKANKCFDEIKDILNLKIKDNCIDLHGISSGTALLASIRFIAQNKYEKLTLICGKGIHSKHLDHGFSPIKKYLLDNLPRYFPNKQISVGSNEGTLKITN